ncbi:MAG: sensor histidine kinase [Bacteroidia bacterium]|nr:sensor histidine kinase [Bacteroidia bacterium]
MQGESFDIFQGFLLGTLLILIFVVAIIAFVVVYNTRLAKKERRILEIEAQHQRDLLESSIASQEKERERIARDLHDEIGAMISTINLGLLQFRKKAEPGSAAANFSSQTMELLNSTAEQVRRISRDLLPATLGRFGLMVSLEELFDWVEKQSGIRMVLEDRSELPPLTGEQELGLYRIVQEAVNNALKHAEATRMVLSLEVDGSELRLQFEDNGKGFSLEEASESRSLGLKNFEARASVLGGKAIIESEVGKGTRIRVNLPIEGVIQEPDSGHV